ncbi:7352_t:CDS:2, partial [Gigaspora rosea]
NITQHIGHLQKKFDNLSAEYDKTVRELEKVDSSNLTIEKMLIENENLRLTNDRLNAKVSANEEEVNSLKENLKTLRNELEHLHSISDQISMESLQEKISELEAGKEGLEQANKAFFEEPKKLDQGIDSLLNQLKERGENKKVAQLEIAQKLSKNIKISKISFELSESILPQSHLIFQEKITELEHRLQEETLCHRPSICVSEYDKYDNVDRLRFSASSTSSNMEVSSMAPFYLLNFVEFKQMSTEDSKLGGSLFKYDDIYKSLKGFKQKLELDMHGCTRLKLCFAKVDVKRCFELIGQEQVLEIIKDVLKG